MNSLGHHSPILEKLAELYAASTAGQTGQATRNYSIRYPELLKKSGAAKGDAFDLAQSDLLHAQQVRAIEIVEDRRSHDWERIRVPLTCEDALFTLVGRESPTAERAKWTALFDEAASWAVPEIHQTAWQNFCRERSASVSTGRGFDPFRRSKHVQARLQVELAARLLSWHRPCLLRNVSAQLCHDSKRLGLWRGTVEKLLAASTAGRITSFADLGIEDNPTTVRVHGPLRIRWEGHQADYTFRSGEYAISEADLAAAETIETTASLCVTVENPTTFHELTRLGCGDLFVCTSYPNEATALFLRRLPSSVTFHHFGDSDPWGFDVLLALRGKTQRRISPLHMRYRPKPDSPLLDPRDLRKLDRLIAEPLLADVRDELLTLQKSGLKGDFEQERLPVSLSVFPYINGSWPHDM